ncbi:hypothetical protein MVEN_01033400 [Mycena venus]|uniref:Uncharacterized protein n=1 Tax=Mycena venus TaxID=2733690 RepID=A0A8H6YDZ9_9AGAR|nr:hypothetical protein MVEN_01033400 [Mycena venus]
MTWLDYITVGLSFSTGDKAEAMIRWLVFDPAPPEEHAAFSRWREQYGIKPLPKRS